MVKISEGTAVDLGRTSVLNARLTEAGRIAGTYHGELVIFNGQLRRIQAHEGQLLSLLVDSKHIYTGGFDGYIRMRKYNGEKLAEKEIGHEVYGIAEHPKGLAIVDGDGRVYLADKELKNVEQIYRYEEDRPARDVAVVYNYIVVGFYDGLIIALDSKGKIHRKIFRTLGDSVTYLGYNKELEAILAGFRSGRVSIIPVKTAEFTIRSGRSKKKIAIKPRTSLDLQTIGSVTRRVDIVEGSLLALGANGKLYEQSLQRLINAALSTRGTRIVARHTHILHEYGANGAHLEENTLITAGSDGFVRLRSVSV